jgi:hypothetical protein
MNTGTVYPKPGEEAIVARQLLALADDVQHVRTSTDDGFAFLVPEYLLDRYVAAQADEDEQPTEVTPEQQRRRPGRPRKAQPVSEGD